MSWLRPELHHGVLRHRAADHQRGGAGLDLSARGRGDRTALGAAARPRRAGTGCAADGGIILVVGAIATNVFGKRVLQRAEYYLLQVPVFKTIYAPVKQLIAAFSPDNEAGFKKVVIVEDPRRGMTARVSDQGVHARSRTATDVPVVAVYVPTNHLYLGRCARISARAWCSIPTSTVEEGDPDLSDRRHGVAEPASQ